ncbi:unnamed protein product, partial [Amoebophrya sp. A25]|eukprot:GSA25T00011886001.1
MRKLGRGQSVVFAGTGEISRGLEQIKTQAGANPSDSINLNEPDRAGRQSRGSLHSFDLQDARRAHTTPDAFFLEQGTLT